MDTKILGVIVARGGSKGLPGKNIADLGGEPVIAWSIAAARASKLITRTIVSTDDPDIVQAAKAAGGDVPFVRPSALAMDDTPIADVLLHAIDALSERYDHAVLLQATSPLRTASDIDGCIEALKTANAPTAVTVTASDKPVGWMFSLRQNNQLEPLSSWDELKKRRQEMPLSYLPNGAVYVVEIAKFRQNHAFYGPGSVGYPMPRERSVDIDTQFDLALARFLLLSNQ